MRALEQLASIFKESTTANGKIAAPPRMGKFIIQENCLTKSVPPPRVPTPTTPFHKKNKGNIAINNKDQNTTLTTVAQIIPKHQPYSKACLNHQRYPYILGQRITMERNVY